MTEHVENMKEYVEKYENMKKYEVENMKGYPVLYGPWDLKKFRDLLYIGFGTWKNFEFSYSRASS